MNHANNLTVQYWANNFDIDSSEHVHQQTTKFIRFKCSANKQFSRFK